MTKNISTKLKTLLTLGVVTVATASSIVPVSALSHKGYTKLNNKSVVYLYINGVKYKLPTNPSCPIKPELKPEDNNNNNSGATNKPENNTNNNSGTTNKPETKPEDNNNNNSGSTNKPETKPEDNNNNNSGSTNKPETKPEDNNNSGATTGQFAAYQKEVVDLVNVERTKRGLSPLTLDAKVSDVATKKSQDMINKNYFDHNSPTYGSPFDMMKQFGISYRAAGENIAMGQRNPQEVVTAWMNSEGHRKNILNSSFTKIGVGVAQKSNGTLYWTQMFIG
ncbi:CAP domain-containing protein [[Clostridium] dakarense]|uniref:CAP domain-containing protein n=1 Tax=Faecalimicrobium dakarense TaxID=1301100 RepID=UPI0004B977D3|nr:CAP domain-containing protein [[Clostridium] dakarense]